MRNTERSRSRYRTRSRTRSRSRNRKSRDNIQYSNRDDGHYSSRDDRTRDHGKYSFEDGRDYDRSSLQAKKLAALDHEKFLIDRQKQRESTPFDPLRLWPKSPQRNEINLEAYVVEYENIDAEGKGIEDGEVEVVTDTVESTESTEREPEQKDGHSHGETEDEGDFDVIRVKAPTAPSKPSINSFSSSKATRYGGDLMPGEGSAMADFIAKGQRIPRRGEIGLDSSEIARFESAGYVMSGSRHHLMNAVRMRKENQVISAEEKKMISQMAIEERIKREEEIVKTFKAMVDEKMKLHKNEKDQ